MSNLLEKVKEFPKTPGVYLMKDTKGKIIYVGKAKNLRTRVRQYFSKHDTRHQISFLMARVEDIDFILTRTEKEALLLENSLIKKHKPRYNVFLKDDKTYSGLKLTLADDFPRLIKTRKIRKDGSKYYGPFTSADRMYEVQEFIYRFFLLRTCSDHEFQNRTRPCLEYQIKRCSAPCVNYVSKEEYAEQITDVRDFLEGKNKKLQKEVKTRMLQASDAENFEEASRLRDLLQSMTMTLQKQQVTQLSFEFVDLIAFEKHEKQYAISVLMVRDSQLIDSKSFVLNSLEDEHTFLQNFIAQYYSDRAFIPKEILLPIELNDTEILESLLQERAGYKIQIRKPKRGEKKELLDLAFKNLASHFKKSQDKTEAVKAHLKTLQSKLHLPALPTRMECYDISNISGKQAVGSMVTFIEGSPEKSLYKKFKIRGWDTPNDYAMLKEVLERRFKKSDGDWEHPDLLLIDGGKGQLKIAEEVLKELQLTIPLASISKGAGQGARAKGVYDDKKEDEVYLPGRKNPVTFRRGDQALMILQNLRDESHRFAIGYHRKLREKDLTKSWLDDVKGLGPKKKAALMQALGSPETIKKATPEDLKKVEGLSEGLIQKIVDAARKSMG